MYDSALNLSGNVYKFSEKLIVHLQSDLLV